MSKFLLFILQTIFRISYEFIFIHNFLILKFLNLIINNKFNFPKIPQKMYR